MAQEVITKVHLKNLSVVSQEYEGRIGYDIMGDTDYCTGQRFHIATVHTDNTTILSYQDKAGWWAYYTIAMPDRETANRLAEYHTAMIMQQGIWV